LYPIRRGQVNPGRPFVKGQASTPLLSILLAFSLLADGIDVRGDLDDDPEEEASSIDARAISFRFKDSKTFTNAPAGD